MLTTLNVHYLQPLVVFTPKHFLYHRFLACPQLILGHSDPVITTAAGLSMKYGTVRILVSVVLITKEGEGAVLGVNLGHPKVFHLVSCIPQNWQ